MTTARGRYAKGEQRRAQILERAAAASPEEGIGWAACTYGSTGTPKKHAPRPRSTARSSIAIAAIPASTNQ